MTKLEKKQRDAEKAHTIDPGANGSDQDERDWLTPREYAKKVGIDRSRVQRLLQEGRIQGAKKYQHGPLKVWAIPQGAKIFTRNGGPDPKWKKHQIEAD